MITLNLEDPRVVEHFEMIQSIRKLGLLSDEEIQEMYDRQLAKDVKDGGGNG